MSQNPLFQRRTLALLGLVVLTLYIATAAYHQLKPLPPGVDVAGPYRPVTSIEFLADATWLDSEGEQHTDQVIFDTAFSMIERAQSTAVANFFLVNDFAGATEAAHRPLSAQLTDALIERQQRSDAFRAMLVTDPFNTLYGGVEQPLFERLEAERVMVVPIALERLRDSNPTWSALWRMCCQWFGNSPGGWLPNPVGEIPVSLRTYLTLLNFKANHRKTLITDTDGVWQGLVTSGNPHDASSRHRNIAVRFDGPAVADLLETELAVAAWSDGPQWPMPDIAQASQSGVEAELRVLTEASILDAALAMIDAAGPGDELDMLMFYLSHRVIIDALVRAHERGSSVRVLLDANQDAFGREKGGIPNRPVAAELERAGLTVRWCRTAGEQCHAKLLMRRSADGRAELLAGSANFTRRNLDNFNLETNVQVRAPGDGDFMRDAGEFFDQRWTNTPDRHYSLPFEAHADYSALRYWRYRLMEATGLSTF